MDERQQVRSEVTGLQENNTRVNRESKGLSDINRHKRSRVESRLYKSRLWWLGMLAFAAFVWQAFPAAAQQNADSKLNLNQLPGLLEPQGKPIPEMDFDNPLMTEDEENAFRRSPDPRKRPGIMIFREALRSTRLTDEQRKDIQEGVRWYLARFTMPKYRLTLYRLRQEILRDLHLYAKHPSTRLFFLQELTNAAEEIIEPRKFKITQKSGQDIVIEITDYDLKDGKEHTRTVKVKDATELESWRKKDPIAVELYERYGRRHLYFGGDGGPQHFLVRINAILLLTELDEKEGDPMKNIPAVPFIPVSKVLLRVMNDPQQRYVYRFPAVSGLQRICLYGDLPRSHKLRATVVDLFIRELKRQDTHWWYHKVLVEGLAASGVLYGSDRGGVPIVAQTLAEKIADKKENYQVRAAAAKAIARAELDSRIQTAPIIYAIVDLAYEMAKQYNSKPKAYPWTNCFLDIYLAFKPVYQGEKTVNGSRTAGFLADNKSSKMAEDAYAKLLPVIRAVLHGQGKQRISKKYLSDLAAWLKKNRPQSLSIVPEGKPIMSALSTRTNQWKLALQ